MRFLHVAPFVFRKKFGPFTSPKCDLGEVEKLIFQVIARYWELISASWPAQNATWDRSRKRCFKGSRCTLNKFSASWTTQNATWVRSWKRCFKWSPDTSTTFYDTRPAKNATWKNTIKRCFKGSHGNFDLIFCLLTCPKCDLGEVEKAMFQVGARY